jgi:hypothetical protein
VSGEAEHDDQPLFVARLVVGGSRPGENEGLLGTKVYLYVAEGGEAAATPAVRADLKPQSRLVIHGYVEVMDRKDRRYPLHSFHGATASHRHLVRPAGPRTFIAADQDNPGAMWANDKTHLPLGSAIVLPPWIMERKR